MNILHKTSIAAVNFSKKLTIFSALAVSLAATYIAPAKAQQVSSINNLDGTWNYQVSLPASRCSVQGACLIKIVGSLGQYILPTDAGTGGAFLFNLYPTTVNRGQPVVTMVGIGATGQETTYVIVNSGRLNKPGLITGRFVDVDNNEGTFTLTKQLLSTDISPSLRLQGLE